MVKKENTFRLLLYFLLFTTGSGSALAQLSEHKTDSILTLIQKTEIDTIKSDLYFTLAKFYQQENNTDSALISYQQAYRVLNDSMSDNVEKVLNEIGLLYYRRSNFANALTYFQRSLQIAKKNHEPLSIARRHSNIAVIYDFLGDYVKSVEYNQEALKIFEQQGNKKGMAFIYNNLGVLSEEMENPDQALNYHRQALKIKMELNDPSGVGSSLNNLGVVFEQLLPNYDSSIYYYRKAYEVFRKADSQSGIATSLGNIGVIHRLNHQPDSAVFYAEKALKIRSLINDEEGKSSCLFNLGKAQYDLREYKASEKFFQQSLKISKKINSRKRTSKIYEALALLYNHMHENEKAYEYHVKYSQLKDSILNSENSKQIAELKTRYELEKKNQQLSVLSQKNILQKESIVKYNFLLLTIFLIAILITFIAILLFRQNRFKARQQTFELQQKLLRSQMNPHFIFNTLFSIQTYMLENDAISASRFLSRFAKLMRHILENSKHEYVSLENEIEFLKNYLFIQQLRFDESFTYEVKYTGKEESSQILIPPMLSQPFIENAIDHGIRNIDKEGVVKVHFSIRDEMLKVTIADNGVGFYHKKPGHQKLKNHKSTGVENTRQRIKILANKYKSEYLFEISDLNRENPSKTGTIVTFAIPLIFA